MEYILKLRKYAIQDKETGTVYEDADTIEKAEEIVKLFEQIDRDGGNCKVGTYKIVTRDQLREDLPSNYTIIDTGPIDDFKEGKIDLPSNYPEVVEAAGQLPTT